MERIKERLKGVADMIHSKDMSDQLECAGEAIETEFRKLADRIKRFETAKDIGEIAGVGQIESRIKVLEERQGDMNCDIQTIVSSLTVKEEIPTDRHNKPKFQVGDTIKLYGGGLRIVLKINPDNRMKLMTVPGAYDQGGQIQELCCPENYTLVYRPTFKAEKDKAGVKIPYDRHGKPEGGLEPGDVVSYKDRNGKVFGIFSHKNDNICADWMHPLKPNPHINFSAYATPSDVTFEFRPKYPGEV